MANFLLGDFEALKLTVFGGHTAPAMERIPSVYGCITACPKFRDLFATDWSRWCEQPGRHVVQINFIGVRSREALIRTHGQGVDPNFKF